MFWVFFGIQESERTSGQKVWQRIHHQCITPILPPGIGNNFVRNERLASSTAPTFHVSPLPMPYLCTRSVLYVLVYLKSFLLSTDVACPSRLIQMRLKLRSLWPVGEIFLHSVSLVVMISRMRFIPETRRSQVVEVKLSSHLKKQ